MSAPAAGGSGIGAAVKRKEDLRFLTGKGRYVDDIELPGQLYAAIVRSPHAHAEIQRVNLKDAERAPGVEDPAGAPLRQSQDRGHLEPQGSGDDRRCWRAQETRAGGHHYR